MKTQSHPWNVHADISIVAFFFCETNDTNEIYFVILFFSLSLSFCLSPSIKTVCQSKTRCPIGLNAFSF